MAINVIVKNDDDFITIIIFFPLLFRALSFHSFVCSRMWEWSMDYVTHSLPCETLWSRERFRVAASITLLIDELGNFLMISDKDVDYSSQS
jgi:hypothetical protein